MCRNIRILFNFDPPATEEEVRAAALQYVRKVSGTTKPSKVNEPAFEEAVEEIARITSSLMTALTTTSPARDRQIEAAKAKERAKRRYGEPSASAKG